MSEPLRSMRRYHVPVDGQPHEITSTFPPVKVAAARFGGVEVVEFWTEHVKDVPQIARTYQVFGTGHEIPKGAIWVGTTDRTAPGFVWHLFEILELSADV